MLEAESSSGYCRQFSVFNETDRSVRQTRSKALLSPLTSGFRKGGHQSPPRDPISASGVHITLGTDGRVDDYRHTYIQRPKIHSQYLRVRWIHPHPCRPIASARPDRENGCGCSRAATKLHTAVWGRGVGLGWRSCAFWSGLVRLGWAGAVGMGSWTLDPGARNRGALGRGGVCGWE